ncbi:MAG TPA: hypothetical protein VHX20_11360 [Terracidiphilus sp.]|nr:hypothetical protein [Terracidiphilus sp.]
MSIYMAVLLCRPFGDAHEHNFDNVSRTPAVVAKYLHDGIFYAHGMTDITRGAEAVVAAGLVNTPQSVDVTYAHGGLTAVDGHPKEVYESIANGFYYPSSPEQRSLVIGSHRRARQVYWEIDSPADLDTKWPQALASKPDLIKIFLSNSEHYTSDSHRHPVLGDGLDPALVPLITVRAHAAGLKVAAHVDTAADYHFALVGGVDEMGHLPGYGIRASSNLVTFRISDADIALSALRHIKVQATAGIDVDANTPEPDLKARQDSQRENLTRLKAAGVPILIGSDHYGEDSLHEADYLHSLGIWSNGELLRMWSVETPQTIFPHRTIGELKPEYEASFLVLSANPLKDWAAIHRIVNRWKQGVRVEIN